MLALDQRSAPPAPGKRGGQGPPSLAGSYDDGIVPLGSAHGLSLCVGGETVLGLGM